jgi:hypothetical protein
MPRLAALRHGVPRIRFHQPNIGRRDSSIDRDIRTEIRGGHGDARGRFHLTYVRCGDGLARIDVADEHVHAHGRAREKLAELVSHLVRCHRYPLHVGYAGQVYRHRPPVEGRTRLNAADACRHTRGTTGEIVRECEHQRVIAVAAPAFHPGLACEREGNVEDAGGTMRSQARTPLRSMPPTPQ